MLFQFRDLIYDIISISINFRYLINY